MKQRSFSRKRNEISSANLPRVLNRNPKVFTHVSVLTKDTAFPFLLQDLLGLHGFPRLFTVTSEHIPFFLLFSFFFCFTLFSCRFRAVD